MIIMTTGAASTYQWAQRKSSRETIAAVPLDFLKVAYHGLHDLDLNLAVAKVVS